MVLSRESKGTQFKPFELLGVSPHIRGHFEGWFQKGRIDTGEQDETAKWGMTTQAPIQRL